MAARSNTLKVIRPPREALEIVFATIDEREFAHARKIVAGFRRWESFDDFVSERDGQFIGSACAGQIVHQVDVSIQAFEAWALHAGVSTSIKALDAFAAQIRAFRLNHDGRDARAPSRGGETRARTAAPELYQEWLETLAGLDMLSENPSIEVYARLLMEGWAETY